ncbi:MAG: ABC-type transport auxiliary lipoprotein family protein [Pseudomonadota bacterium]
MVFRSSKLSFAKLTLLGASALALSSCALLQGPEAPRETYELTAVDDVAGLTGATRAQILVKVPSALKSIDSDRIVVRPTPSVVTYLAGAQWSDTLPRMVQAKLVTAFENTAATGATAQPGDGLVIDYQLIGQIRRFGIDETARQARLEMSVKLLSDRSGKVVETRVFTATAPAGSGADYVAALDRAFDALTRDIVRWVIGRT